MSTTTEAALTPKKRNSKATPKAIRRKLQGQLDKIRERMVKLEADIALIDSAEPVVEPPAHEEHGDGSKVSAVQP